MTAESTAKNPRESHLDGSSTRYFDVTRADRETLEALLRELFEVRWADIVFGILLPGAVFELRFSQAPRVSYLDGYLTIGLESDPSHMHLCIGPHAGTRARPTPPALAALRRCARAAFYRDEDPGGRPSSWGLRLWNGGGEQMLNVFFPSPWLSRDRLKPLREPVPEHLALWNELRARFADVPPEPLDTLAERPAIH